VPSRQKDLGVVWVPLIKPRGVYGLQQVGGEAASRSLGERSDTRGRCYRISLRSCGLRTPLYMRSLELYRVPARAALELET
jgi:hypothetical protein